MLLKWSHLFIDDKEQIGFSFESQSRVTVLGQVRKLIDLKSDGQTDMTIMLNEIQKISFEVMKKLGLIKQSPSNEYYIIFPIAVFYEAPY